MIALSAHFLPVLDRLDPTTAFSGQYDRILVAISLAIGVLAAYVALSISGRVVAAKTTPARLAWTSAGAISMGGGIWSMHFIGMLAFKLPCGVTYSPTGTLLSMIPGVLASGIALNAISARHPLSFMRLLVSAVLMGAGIGAMHYAGMAAMRPDALLLYNADYVLASVVVAVVLALVSLSIHSRRSRDGGFLLNFAAAAIMGCAIAGMHYTAMQAAIFFPQAGEIPEALALHHGFLAITVAFSAVLTAAGTLVATFVGRQNDLVTDLAAEVAERRQMGQDLVHARELAEAANLAKSQFLASMSHEIRTPLNGVIGNLELMGLTSPSAEQSDLIDQADRAAKSLLALIGNILDFSKIEQGKLAIEMGDLCPTEIVEEAVAVLQSRARQKSLFVTAIFSADVPALVQCDAVRLRQILLNLIGNALKFTDVGGIGVRVSVNHWDGDVCDLKFAVHDSGRGFEPSLADMLFEPFTQDKTAAEMTEGTGLGLSICRKLVEAMGGSIGCESVVGEGATFWFCLPMRTIERNSRTLPTDLSGSKIAIVGQSHPGASPLAQFFTTRRASIVRAENVADAIAAIGPCADGPNVALLAPESDMYPDDVRGLRAKGIIPVTYGSDGSARSYRRALRAGFAVVISTGEGPAFLDRNIATLFAHAPHHDSPAAPRLDGYAVDQDLRGKHVLVLEDRLVNQLVIQKQLTVLQVRFTVAGDGVMGLAAMESQDFDLILCDCSMPNMDGYDFTRAVRRREEADGATRHVPIVALTANAFREDVDKCRAAGMDDFISKPVNLDRLSEALSKWLAPVQSAPQPSLHAETADGGLAVDVGVLASMLGPSAAELTDEILTEFADAARKSYASLESAFANGRLNGIQVLAHGAKGEARSAGAVRLGDLYAELERQAKAGDCDEFEGAVRRIGVEIDRVEEFITHRLAQAA